MKGALYLAAYLLIAVGVAHSILGERYILIRLFRRDNLPKLFGGTDFTTRTIRFVWHILSIAWWGFAAILFCLAYGTISLQVIAMVIGITFVATGITALVISRAKHLAWVIFIVVGTITICVGVT